MRHARRHPRSAAGRVFVTGWAGCAALLQAGAASGQPSGERAGLDEVVVTARKIAEDISRVPMSVQLLSADHLERRDLSNLYDLQYEVPGLVINNRGMFGAGISLRGVADEGGGGLAVAPHFNGVYLGRANLALARPFDLGRVEVVKGPQGTLYGRNATGGSINIISRIPDPEFNAAIEAASGTFDTTRINAHVNLPGDRFAVRFAIAGADGGGYIRNSLDDRRFAEEDYRAVRASVRAEPSDRLTIGATLQRVEDDGATGELWSPRPDQLPDPRDIHLTRVALADPFQSTVNDFASLSLDYEFAGFTLRSITGHARHEVRDRDDCEGTPALPGCVRGVHPLRYRQFSEELRIESREGGALDWLVGVYFFDGDEFQNFYQSRSTSPQPIYDYTATADETAYAVFGDVTRPLGARWRLNGGLRFSSERRRVTNVGSGSQDSPTLLAAKRSWDATSWRVSVDYSPGEQVFLYANVSNGFKSGGVTTTRLPTGEFDDYEPEAIIAYEAGVTAKSSEGNASLRASAFVYDFEDMQVTTTALFGDAVRTVVDNAAAVRIHGLDVHALGRFARHFTVSGGVVWLPRREFVEFIDAEGRSISGNDVSRASEFSASATIGYRVPMSTAGELSASVDYNWRSAFFFTKENSPLFFQDDFGLLNLNLRFDSSRADWYVFASARNLLDEDYFTQILFQSAPGYPSRYEAGFGWRF
jgi:iron complex outermembrane recepter protein